jgi:putative transposase
MMDRYAKNAAAVVSLKYHVVFCPKYRRPVLTPPVDQRLKEVLAETAEAHGITFHTLEVMPDPTTCICSSRPTRPCVWPRSSTA